MTSLSLFTFMHWRRKWQPTPVFLPGESQGRGCLMGCRLWGRTESDRLKRLSSSSSNDSVSKEHCPTVLHFLSFHQVVPVVKNPSANAGDIRDGGLIPGSGRSPGGGHGNPLHYSFLVNPHGQRSLAGYSPWGCKDSDMTKQLSM